CMNFYNQLFACRQDTLRRFLLDYNERKDEPTFNNVVIGTKYIWLHSYFRIYCFNKANGRLQQVIIPKASYSQVVASAGSGSRFMAITYDGHLFLQQDDQTQWKYLGPGSQDMRLLETPDGCIGLSTEKIRKPGFILSGQSLNRIPAIDLDPSIVIFQAVQVGKNDYWLCTQNGVYRWDPFTGKTEPYLAGERIADVVRDYQGNYWFGSLDNGLYNCPSLQTALWRIYRLPLLDNFTHIAALPGGEIVAGNSQGLMVQVNFEKNRVTHFQLSNSRETEFIRYDSISGNIFSNRGVFRPGQSHVLEIMDYSKGIARDKFNNLLVAVFNGAYVLNDHIGSKLRFPELSCPLYRGLKSSRVNFDGRCEVLRLRAKRTICLLADEKKQGFWVGYEDGIFAYRYDGNITELLDREGKAVIARSLIQLPGDVFAAGSSAKGVLLFRNGKEIKRFDISDGLESNQVKKLLFQDGYLWVLTETGLDRIQPTTGEVLHMMDLTGLDNVLVQDFLIVHDKLLLATTFGLLRLPVNPPVLEKKLRFPVLTAFANGKAVKDGEQLPAGAREISLHFEAVHFISAENLHYRYRLLGLDTEWHPFVNVSSQVSFYRLAPGSYTFEIVAAAGNYFHSDIQSFRFQVPKPWWQHTGILLLLIVAVSGLIWLILRQWKKSLLRRQTIRGKLVKSQLVALRAQMNPHFLYNVLNTVQGLVYSNRKTEAGELLGNFSDLMRKTLQASNQQLMPLQEEIENIRLYLELEKARFDEGFSYSIEVSGIEDTRHLFIPSLILQPFAENAVKHGLMHRAGDKKLLIRFEKERDALRVIIDDNGVGRQQSREINQRSSDKPYSFATLAIHERLELFNSLYQKPITCEIEDKKNAQGIATGTRVQIRIPDFNIQEDSFE
ncbi:MAG TPA: histidine kinase, partial [Sediminibacterium sp.]|nr:histidine kinase [Sediminibacterium sp.]